MLREPICRMSAYSATMGTSSSDITSVTMARPVSCARASQHLQAFEAKSLKCIRRTARLEGASAQDARAGAAHMVGRGHQLELGLHRAGPSHGDELAAADLQIQHRHYCLLAPRALQAHRGFRQIVRANFHAPCALRSGEDSGYRNRACRASIERWRRGLHVTVTDELDWR